MVNFEELKQQYKQYPIETLKRLLENGKIEGGDYVALNPRRSDKKAGSFRIDISSGKFYDFATEDKGGSVIDLAMFVYNCGIVEAAKRLEALFPFLASTSVAADNDKAGRKSAEDAKQATIEIVYPTHECNDFNDLHVAYGTEEVKACFKEVLHG